MYDQASITALENRIGFGNMEIPVTVSPIHRVGDSGRVLPYFHKIADLNNIYQTTEKIAMTEIDFNEHLEQLKSNAVKGVLAEVFHKQSQYDIKKDYSQIIFDYMPLFDDAIGYTLAVSTIEQMVSTCRSNNEERNTRFTYDKLKIELEGLKDGYGNVVSNGLKRMQYTSVKKVGEILFPNKLTIENYQW